jgi:hypothetical protein
MSHPPYQGAIGHIAVRVQISSERPTEARKELTGMAGTDPRREGTDKDLIWDFHSRERADFFATSAKYVPGVVGVRVRDGEWGEHHALDHLSNIR